MFINSFSNSIISFTECTISCTLYPWSVRYWWGNDRSWCPNYYYSLGSDGLFLCCKTCSLVRCGSKRLFVVVWRIFALVYFLLLLITCQKTGNNFTLGNWTGFLWMIYGFLYFCYLNCVLIMHLSIAMHWFFWYWYVTGLNSIRWHGLLVSGF